MPNVISADGTKIAYEKEGSGPVVILVDGALCSRVLGPMESVAKLLSANFTVVRYDRRGRNESTNAESDVANSTFSIEREVEDLTPLAKELQSEPFVFGISSGAVLILQAAMSGLRFKKIALFEPPVIPTAEGARDTGSEDHVKILSNLIRQGDRSSAVKHFMAGMVGVPKPIVAIMRLLPLWKKLKAVAHTLPYDATLTRPGALTQSGLKAVHTKALVMWGEKSPAFLRESGSAVAANLSAAQALELKGQNHSASGKALAPPVSQFFLA